MRIFLTALVFTVISFANAQNVEFKKKSFNSEEEYSQALEALETGDEYFFAGDFDKALPRFLTAQKLNANNATLNFKIGACYLKQEELKKANPYFEKAKSLDPKVDPKIDFALAQSLQACQRYDEAIESYQIYLAGLSKNKKPLEEPMVQKNIDICTTEYQKVQSKIQEEKELEQAKESEPTETVTEQPIVEKPIEPEVTSEITEEPQNESSKPIEVEQPQSAPQEAKTNSVLANSSKEIITYRIQISSTSIAATDTDLKKIYAGPLKITHEFSGGTHKYFIGDFENRQEALKAKALSGISDAFLVKFQNGKKI